jgi:hypothetical protein
MATEVAPFAQVGVAFRETLVSDRNGRERSFGTHRLRRTRRMSRHSSGSWTWSATTPSLRSTSASRRTSRVSWHGGLLHDPVTQPSTVAALARLGRPNWQGRSACVLLCCSQSDKQVARCTTYLGSRRGPVRSRTPPSARLNCPQHSRRAIAFSAAGPRAFGNRSDRRGCATRGPGSSNAHRAQCRASTRQAVLLEFSEGDHRSR